MTRALQILVMMAIGAAAGVAILFAMRVLPLQAAPAAPQPAPTEETVRVAEEPPPVVTPAPPPARAHDEAALPSAKASAAAAPSAEARAVASTSSPKPKSTSKPTAKPIATSKPADKPPAEKTAPTSFVPPRI